MGLLIQSILIIAVSDVIEVGAALAGEENQQRDKWLIYAKNGGSVTLSCETSVVNLTQVVNFTWVNPQHEAITSIADDSGRRTLNGGIDLFIPKVMDETKGIYHCVMFYDGRTLWLKRALNYYDPPENETDEIKRRALAGGITSAVFLVSVVSIYLISMFTFHERTKRKIGVPDNEKVNGIAANTVAGTTVHNNEDIMTEL